MFSQFSQKKAESIAAAGYSARYAALFVIAIEPEGDFQYWHEMIASDLYSYGKTLTNDFPASASALRAEFDDPAKLIRYLEELHSRIGLHAEQDLFDLAGVLCFYFEGILRDDESPESGYLAEVLARVEDHLSPSRYRRAMEFIISEGQKMLGTGMENILPRVRSSIMKVTRGIIEISKTGSLSSKTLVSGQRDVFVVHGHDEVSKLEVARFLEKLGLRPVILHERPSGGRTIIEKFEALSNVAYALVLLTPDDLGSSKASSNTLPRARQNVVFELGYFFGKLGRDRVCALYKEGVEFPSDLNGIVYVTMDAQGAWKLFVGKEMKQTGMEIDLNLALA